MKCWAVGGRKCTDECMAYIPNPGRDGGCMLLTSLGGIAGSLSQIQNHLTQVRVPSAPPIGGSS